jgi:hypothetical protein
MAYYSGNVKGKNQGVIVKMGSGKMGNDNKVLTGLPGYATNCANWAEALLWLAGAIGILS